MRAARAFTLVEMLMVVAIVGLLLAISLVGYERYAERSRVVRSIVELTEMSDAIRDYERKNGVLPDALGDVNGGQYAGRQDPWGWPYEYYNLRGLKGNGQARKDKALKPLNSDFDLYSIGPDGQTAASLSADKSRDDVLRARDGRFIGPAIEFDP